MRGAQHLGSAITPGAEAPVKLLTERGYKAQVPDGQDEVRHPLARFDGSLEVDESHCDVDGWTGSVNHNWGPATPPRTRTVRCAGSTGRRNPDWRS